ncbi:MAG: signal peptidase II, partial [Candidatus Woesearchaeota archaeon]
RVTQIFFIVLLFLLDRITKLLVIEFMNYGQTILLIPKILSLTYVHNTGVAFGMFSTMGGILTLLLTIVVIALVFYYKRVPSMYRLGYVLVTLGAIGNLIDRYMYSDSVIDFIHVPFFSVFNFADIYITFGAIILFFAMRKADKKGK